MTSLLWTEEWINSLQELRAALVSAPALAFPRSAEPNTVGIGAVLSQVCDRGERVIAYYSHALSKSERNYCSTSYDLLAVFKAIEHCHPYLYDRQFTVRSDHAFILQKRSDS